MKNTILYLLFFFMAQNILATKTTKLYEHIDISFINPTFSGNAYDLEATATFTHSGGTVMNGTMFYNENNNWVARFTGTKIGEWVMETSSIDEDLNGKKDTINVTENPGSPGFITNFGNKWGRTGTNEAFVPNLIMYYSPGGLSTENIVAGIDTFITAHGFNGFHVIVANEWYQYGDREPDKITSENPDPKTFEVLEELISKTYAVGGVVHFWFSGDCTNNYCSKYIPGMNGELRIEEKRVLRMIAGRLAPLPGWSMGFGFDITEDHSEKNMNDWGEYLQERSLWKHTLGARTEKPKVRINNLYRTTGIPLWNDSNYEGWVDHRPSYEWNVKVIDRNKNKPTFMEDRFRFRPANRFAYKDYDMETTRTGLWYATMAGGAAGIWGHLFNSPEKDVSVSYPKPYYIKTYQKFFENRFKKDMLRDSTLIDGGGYCLKNNNSLLFFQEETNSITFIIPEVNGKSKVIAVDSKKIYAEIDLGTFNSGEHTYTAPYVSDWGLAVVSVDSPNQSGIIFDVDLTQGIAGGGEVTGGVWDNGWKVTEGSNQRIVYDCGYNIVNGYIEATFTIDQDPFAGNQKSNYFGAYESSALHQGSYGDKVYLRSGKSKYGFSRIKAFYKPMIVAYAGEVWEKNIGGSNDWITDGTTLHTIRITWQDGTITYTGTGGTRTKTYADFDSLRYVFIGAGKTYGYGIIGQKFKSLKIVDLGVTTSIEGDENVGILNKFEVSQNYPNPFNPSTKIEYSLQEAGLVVLTIYDITGRRVTELVNEQKSAGSYTATWEARDSNGRSVTSGVYLYNIQHNEQVKNSKMIYLR